jgi:hypothetical protein
VVAGAGVVGRGFARDQGDDLQTLAADRDRAAGVLGVGRRLFPGGEVTADRMLDELDDIDEQFGVASRRGDDVVRERETTVGASTRSGTTPGST